MSPPGAPHGATRPLPAIVLHPAEPGRDCGFEGLVLLDSQQLVVAVSPTAAYILGQAAPQLVGRPLADLLTPAAGPAGAVRAVLAAEIAQAAARAAPLHAPVAVEGCSLPRDDGGERAVRMAIARVAGAKLKPGMGHAVSAALLSLGDPSCAEETESHRLMRRFRLVVELSPVAIWIAEGDRVIFANEAAATMLAATSAAALVGEPLQNLLRADAHAELQRTLALARQGERAGLHARLLRKDGHLREVEIAMAALPDHGHTTLQIVVEDVSQRRAQIRELESSRLALRRLSSNVVEAREDERRRIARELHDELGQGLSALKMDIADCAAHAGWSPLEPRVAGMMGRLDEIVSAVRRIAADLRPLMLDDLGLGDAIESLVHDIARRQGITIHLHRDEIGTPDDERASIALYRMVQEALTNVGRHSHATAVDVDLRQEGDQVVLTVHDNGIGLPAPTAHRDSQFGLLGMQERAAMLGGRFEAGNAADGGARLQVRLPLRRAAPHGGTPAAPAEPLP